MREVSIRQIVAAVDLGESSTFALRYARSLADHFGARVTALYADRLWTLQSYDAVIIGCDTTAAQYSDQLATEVRRFVLPYLDGCRFDVIVRMDDPPHAITACARDLNADLIVMGTHARHGFERFLSGSVAETVVRTSDCPVIVVPKVESGTLELPSISRIVCAVDESQLAGETREMASILSRMYGADLHVVKIDPAVQHGNPADRLMQSVTETHADLVVCGVVHGGKRLNGRLIRQGHTPVLTVWHA